MPLLTERSRQVAHCPGAGRDHWQARGRRPRPTHLGLLVRTRASTTATTAGSPVCTSAGSGPGPARPRIPRDG